MAVRRPVHAEERTVAEHAEALLFGNRPAPGRSTQADVAIRQRLPCHALRVCLRQKVLAAEQHTLGAGEKGLPEPTDRVQRDIGGAVVEEGPADVPEEPDRAGVRVLAVDLELADRDGEPLLRPRAAMIVAVLENVVAKRVDARAPPAFVRRVIALTRRRLSLLWL